MKLPSLPATLLMGTLALSPQVHADETPVSPPPKGTPTTETVIVKAPSGRESMQALAAQHGLVLADAGTTSKHRPVISHSEAGYRGAGREVSRYVNDAAAAHDGAAAAHDGAAAAHDGAAAAHNAAGQISQKARADLDAGGPIDAEAFLRKIQGG